MTAPVTRCRKLLIEAHTWEGRRLSKVLEDAGIKVDSVASELLGKAGRAIIEALIAGQRDPAVLCRKSDELAMACSSRFTTSHAQMCRLPLDAYDHHIGQIAALVAESATPFAELITRLMTIPGIGQYTADVIVAGTGGDRTRFPAPVHLAARCGLAPINRESAGKRMRAATRMARATQRLWRATNPGGLKELGLAGAGPLRSSRASDWRPMLR